MCFDEIPNDHNARLEDSGALLRIPSGMNTSGNSRRGKNDDLILRGKAKRPKRKSGYAIHGEGIVASNSNAIAPLRLPGSIFF